MRLPGTVASSTLVDALLRLASAAEIEALDLAQDARVVSIQRIRLADDVPQSFERAVLPTSCAAVLAPDVEHGSLHAALQSAGQTPVVAPAWISARMSAPQEARRPALSGQREPLLVERRIIRDQDYLPVEFTESAYVASRYVIDGIRIAEWASRGHGYPGAPCFAGN